MGTPVITPAEVRAVSITGYFADPPFTDAIMQECINVVTLWYGATYLEALTGTPNAIKYTVAHVLWLQAKGEQGGLAAIVGASSRKLDMVGQRSYSVGAWNPDDFASWLTMWSPWKAKLSGILAGLPPGMTTTGGC